MLYTKLNTNESPFPPSPAVVRAAEREAGRLQLYSDPACNALRAAAAAHYGVGPENIMAVNGSDEALYFAFHAFGDEKHPFAFPDITYGFYPVYADVLHIPAHILPVGEDLAIDPADYLGLGENIVLANPNAPTGQLLGTADIRRILLSNPDSVVVVDEAYINFGGESCVPLISEFDNLLVVQTFSKSHSLAGGRLGFAIGPEALIRDLNTLRYAANPYNVNRMTQAAGIAALEDNEYYMENCRVIRETRQYTAEALKTMGFEVLPSMANFVFARADRLPGGELYRSLKERGVLVRWFDLPRIRDYVRITIGSREQMDILLSAIEAIFDERSRKS